MGKRNKEFSKKVPFIIVGTKIDLRNKYMEDNILTYEDGVNLSKKIGVFTYIECSSINGINFKRSYPKRFFFFDTDEDDFEIKIKKN
jgi:hypothetical protein